MTSQVHPSSYISDKVNLANNVKIGPYCHINGNISIGENTELKSHVVISGNTNIGKNNIFYPFSNIGCDPQDLKFKGEDSNLFIGDSNIFRENVTISKGTRDGGMLTHINNNNLFMTGVHIAHDCKIGNENIFVNINGELVKRKNAKISVFDSGFLLGDGVWEGIRLHKSKLVFIDEHIERLYNSAKGISLEIGMKRNDLINEIDKAMFPLA